MERFLEFTHCYAIPTFPAIHHTYHRNLIAPDSLMISLHKGGTKVSEGPQSPPAHLGGSILKQGCRLSFFFSARVVAFLLVACIALLKIEKVGGCEVHSVD